MPAAPSKDLYDNFFAIVKNGTEQEAKDFLVDHFQEFSKEDRDAIVLALFEEAAEKQAAATRDVADFQREALALFKQLGDAKTDLEKKGALLDIKEKI